MDGRCSFHSRHVGFKLTWLAPLAIAFQAQPADAATHTHFNPHPEIQMYSYPAASANGAGSVRDRAPTFGAFSGLDDQQQPVFFSGTGYDPSRRGTFIAITNTSDDVPIGLEPTRYQINSLRVKATLLGSLIYEPLNYVLHYDNTLDDSLVLTTAGGDDQGHPMEMYGIGFQGDYEAVSFDPADTAKQYFQLGDVRWKTYQPGDPEYDPDNQDAISPYQFFAVDANGDDAENAVYGGYSATESGGVTAQFTPSPFAIGKMYDEQSVEIAPGTLLKNGDTFIFEPNLSDPGIVSYLQASLAEGHLGFAFSSLHQPAGHDGTVPYPDFYLDDLDVGPNPNGAAPQFALEATVLDAYGPGDYDRDRDVDDDDYAAWRSQFGGTVNPLGAGADGNADGMVDAADYVVWRKNVVTGTGAGVAGTGAAIPEPPATILAVLLVGAMVAARTRRHGSVAVRGG